MKTREEESEREKRTHSQAKCFDHKNTAWSTGNQTVINFCPKCRKAVRHSPLSCLALRERETLCDSPIP